jgi:hypothetical protein
MKNPEAIGIAVSLWHCFRDGKWDEARKLLADEFEAVWPQSREIIKGPDNFIRVNREYPGTHKIQVTNHLHHLDRWEFVDHVATETFIETTDPDGKVHSLYATSFFEIQEEKIISLREYWADTYPAPEWRKHLVEKY